MYQDKLASLLIIAIISSFFIGTPLPAKASVLDWQKGASVWPQTASEFSSSEFKQSLQKWKDTGANYVTIIIPYYQKSRGSTVMYPGYNTPTDSSLVEGINYAHSLGMKVNLKPHLEAEDTTWRANINPSDRTTWFSNYGKFLDKYGELGRLYQVEMYTIGTELINMSSRQQHTTNTSNWKNLISNLRKIYPGKITYSANWGESGWNYELSNIDFWDDLDYIGISAYFYLTSSHSYSSQSLLNKWDAWNSTHIKPIQQKFNKPVIFTEIGYRSSDGALIRPPRWTADGYVDEQEQADGYQALFEYWTTQNFMQGIHIRHWESKAGAGGLTNHDFTPQNKMAEKVIASWFKTGQGSIPAPQPTTISTTSYLSDVNWVSATNGWGPVERNMSVGETAARDGKKITINGAVYEKGLGVHATSKIIYNLQNCQRFTSDIGVDDEVIKNGSVIFQVWNGGTKLYDSGLMTYQMNAKKVDLNISDVSQLTLIVTDSGNGMGSDHADWANAQVICQTSSTPPAPQPTPPATNPTPTPSPEPTPPPPAPTSARIDVWWPYNNASVAGTFPLKAIVPTRMLHEYDMFWQVDGDRLNQMYDSNQESPHKEAWIDVNGWTWKGNGPYKISFIAKDKSGNLIAQHDILIYIAR